MIFHFGKIHNEDVQIKSLEFDNINFFNVWKKDIECKTDSCYVQRSSSIVSRNEKKWYYYCNRAGIYKTRGKGSRQLKSQGTSKIGKQCTAHIKATEKQSGEVSVQYCDFHIHTTRIGHLPLPDCIRETVASKLKDGVAMTKILDDIRDKIAGSFKREHLICKQDIRNIKRQYNIHGVERHKDDQLSVSAWVLELQSLDYNPVVAFKPQGVESDAGIGKEDFVLAIQTKFQCDMMQENGPSLICMDATHGTNHYDFNLITVLVLDDYGEGVPVGWMISNREDRGTLSFFLKSLKARTGPIATKCFMSDDAEQYYSSWTETYAGNPKKLLCCWHVDRAWRVNLKSITNTQKQLEVYHQLRIVLETTNTVEFRKTLQKIISWMLSDDDLVKFAEYFQKWYCKRVEEWAFCYRIGTPANTNMAVESFHRYLKVVYLEGKHNRRIDHLLSTLLRIARDRVYDRAIKLEKGKSTHRICEINKRHHLAIEMMEKQATLHEVDGVWKVPSSSKDDIVYLVTTANESCACKLRCGFCGACVHKYTCSCVDSAVHSTVCKHSHLVQMQVALQADPSSLSSSTYVQTESLQHLAQDHPTLTSHQSVETAKYEMRSLLNDIQAMCDSPSTSDDVVKSGIVHLRCALSTMKAVKNAAPSLQQIPTKETVAPNTNHTLQPRFVSTRKRRRSELKSSLSKPTTSEINTCKSKMLCVEIRVCALCFGEDDKVGSDETVQWIECTQCGTWVHLVCAAARPSTSSNEDYMCDSCGVQKPCNV